MKKTATLLLATAALGASMAACSIDAYDKGEGENSLLTADFVEAHVGSDGLVDYAVTDQDERLTLDTHKQVKWMEKADTAYRAVMYYDKTGPATASLVSMNRVGVVKPVPKDSLSEGMKADPLQLESAWMGKNGKYVNLRLRMMTGETDDEKAVHTLGLVCDSINKGNTNAHITLYHDQGGQPENYSAVTFVSIPTDAVSADSITLYVNTYEGTTIRTFKLR